MDEYFLNVTFVQILLCIVCLKIFFLLIINFISINIGIILHLNFLKQPMYLFSSFFCCRVWSLIFIVLLRHSSFTFIYLCFIVSSSKIPKYLQPPFLLSFLTISWLGNLIISVILLFLSLLPTLPISQYQTPLAQDFNSVHWYFQYILYFWIKKNVS